MATPRRATPKCCTPTPQAEKAGRRSAENRHENQRVDCMRRAENCLAGARREKICNGEAMFPILPYCCFNTHNTLLFTRRRVWWKHQRRAQAWHCFSKARTCSTSFAGCLRQSTSLRLHDFFLHESSLCRAQIIACGCIGEN